MQAGIAEKKAKIEEAKALIKNILPSKRMYVTIVNIPLFLKR